MPGPDLREAALRGLQEPSRSRSARSSREHTPIVEPLSLDEAYLDVTENLQNIPLARDVALAIRAKIKELTGLNASAGISYNKFLAKLASDHRKPNGQYVITPEMGPAFVEALPFGKFSLASGHQGQSDPLRRTRLFRLSDLACAHGVRQTNEYRTSARAYQPSDFRRSDLDSYLAGLGGRASMATGAKRCGA